MRLRHTLVGLALLWTGGTRLAAQATNVSAATSASAAFARGVALADSGKSADAVPHFLTAIAQGFQPVNQAHFRLARAYAKAGQADKALAELEGLAAAGFQNTAVMGTTDFASIRALPRFAAVDARIKVNAHPCDASTKYRQFDFWIGEWDVQPTGQPRGPMGSGSTSRIERQLDGCAIQENWLPVNGVGEGKSFNIYNRVTDKWEQYYVDQRGTITHYTGTVHADGNMYYEAEQFGSSNLLRMTFFNVGPNEVRQLGQTSSDRGKTWTVSFDLTYMRKPAVVASHVMQTPAEFDWSKASAGGAGLQVLSVDGNPQGEGTPFSLRLRLTDGTLVPPHWHPVDEHVVVIQGSALMGEGDQADRARAKELGPGSYAVMPKTMHHYFYAKGETILHLYGIGPFKTFMVTPPSDALQRDGQPAKTP